MKKLLLILLCLPVIGFGQPIVNIPDANFKAYLVGEPSINTNGDSEIQVSEATVFNGTINCPSLNITDLTGIEYFTALTELDCEGNLLQSLDVSTNIALTKLDCEGNLLQSLDVSTNIALTELECRENLLPSLDVSNNTALTELECSENQLTTLDVSANIALIYLECDYNQLTSLDVSANTVLQTLWCENNDLTSLDVSNNNTNFFALNCSSNKLTSLDVSNNNSLTLLQCHDNQLTSLDVRNGNNINFAHQGQPFFDVLNNPNLTCINVDDALWSTTNWTNIDPQHYFSNNCTGTAIEEHTTNKELLKVTDLLGRETKGTKNKPLFYLYNDGTVEKRIVIE